MATAKQYIEKEASYVGISGTDNIFNTWFWGRHVYDANTYPWCAAFQSYCANQIGLPNFSPSASAAGVANQGRRIADSDVQPGDWVLFNWDGRSDTGWADHIGLVEWTDINGSGYFGTIEGNTGATAGGTVAHCTRYNYGSYFTAFFRPQYDGAAAPSAPSKPATTPQKKEDKPVGNIVLKTASLGTPLKYYSAWTSGATLDVQAFTKASGWLPKLSNPSNIHDYDYGAVGDGSNITKLRMYLWSPNEDHAIKYRAKVNGVWLPWMIDDWDTSGSGDDFAGDAYNAIQAIEAKIIKL